MIHYHPKMTTHHSVMTSSLLIKNLKSEKFDDFSSDIDFNSKSDVFRDVIYLLLINVSPNAQRAPPADTMCPPAAAQASDARLLL